MKTIKLFLVVLFSIAIAACGGGGSSTSTGGGNTGGTTSTLSGTAATGAPIVSGNVVAIDSSTPAKTFTTTTSSLGAYTVNVTGGTAPFLLTVTGTVGGQPVTLSSVATALNQTVNITPLTDLIVSTAAGTPGGNALVSLCTPPVQTGCSAALAAATTGTNLSAAVTAVIAMVTPLSASISNPLTTAFVADGTGMDAVLDQILVTPASSQGATATVTLVSIPTQQLGTVTMPATAGGAATPTPVTPPTSNAGLIVGAWSNLMINGDTPPQFGDGTNIVFTFFANGDYMMAQSTTPSFAASGAQPGLERGTYTWNPNTGVFTTGGCPSIDTNGQAGLSHTDPNNCGAAIRFGKISGNTMTVSNSIYGNKITFTRVTGSNPIVGSWYPEPDTTTVLTFFANGDYMQSQGVVNPTLNPDGSVQFTIQQLQVWPGLEHGTYTWNQATGAFASACPTVDTNGTAGLSGLYTGFDSYGGSPNGTCPGTSGTMTVNGNTLTFGSFTASRVTSSTTPVTALTQLESYLADVTSTQGVTELVPFSYSPGPNLVAYNRNWVATGGGVYTQSATVVRELTGTTWSAALTSASQTYPTYYMNVNTTAWTINDGVLTWTLNANNTLSTTHPRVGALTMSIVGTDLTGTPILDAAGAQIGTSTYPAGSTYYTQTGAVSSLASFRIFVEPFYAVTDESGVQMAVVPTIPTTFCTQGVLFRPLVTPLLTGENFQAYLTGGACDAASIAAATTLKGNVTLGEMLPKLNPVAPAVYGVTNGFGKNAILAEVSGVTGVYSGNYQTAGKALGLIFDKNRIAADAEIIANGGVALP